MQRNRVWRDEFTLWYDAAQKSPAKPRAHLNLAGAYIEKRAYDLATREYYTAQRLGGDAPEIYSGLGICSYRKQDWENAERYFRKGLQLDPQHTDSRAGIALVLYRQRKFQEALPYLIAVYPARQESPVIAAMLGYCYLRAGQLNEARSMADHLRTMGYANQANKLQEEIEQKK